MHLPVEAVLFDLDGTLIDHESAAEEALTASLDALPAAQPLGHEREHQHQHQHVVRRWQELETWAMDRYLAGELTFREQRRLRITRLAAELGLGTWSHSRADAWFDRYLTRYEAAWRTYPDVTPALADLTDLTDLTDRTARTARTAETAETTEHGRLRLGVLTNGDAEQQRRKLHTVGLPGLLRHATISSEAGAAKPDERIFRAACRELRLPPSRVAYVGDRLRTDAEAAHAAGLHGIWLDRHGTAPTEPVPRISALTELVPLLSGRRKRQR